MSKEEEDEELCLLADLFVVCVDENGQFFIRWLSDSLEEEDQYELESISVYDEIVEILRLRSIDQIYRRKH